MKIGDGLGERLPFDEPHGVERFAAFVGAQGIDGDDARMFELAGDLGLGHEPPLAIGQIEHIIGQILESHIAL